MSLRALHRALLGLALLAATQAHAAGLVMLQVNPLQTSASVGQLITIELQVQNSGAGTLQDVSPHASVWLDGTSLGDVTAFTPAPVNLSAGLDQVFIFTYSASACGLLSFSASASAYDPGIPGIVNAPVVASALISICSLTATPTPGAPATMTPTPAPPTPGADQRGDASIPNNVFHPERGAPLQLRFNTPQGGTVSISIYDRTGRLLQRFEREVAPGTYTEFWDGRANGALAPTGIYLARFQGRSLSKTIKFALIK